MTFKVSESILLLKKANNLGKHMSFVTPVYMIFKYGKRFRSAQSFDNESYRNFDHDKDGDSDQYMTETLEGPVTRIDRPHNTDTESQEGYRNYKSKLCQSIGKHTFNIVSGIFVSIAATAVWTAVGIYFATNSDNTTKIETTTLNKGQGKTHSFEVSFYLKFSFDNFDLCIV